MHRNEIIEVEITGYAFGGNGIAKIPTENGDFVVFVVAVPDGLPTKMPPVI